MRDHVVLAALALATACAPLFASASPEATAGSSGSASSCITCHRGLEGAQGAPVAAWGADIHAAAGLGCESCHGGNPSPALAEDAGGAMDPAKGYSAAPDELGVPELCARCHASAEVMKRFNPQARIDQLAEYRTSVHGQLNARGDTTAATCIDCHGAHGIRPVSSPDSPVYATNVPKTCARCHADPAIMAPYGIPTTQYAEYSRSAHASALIERGDASAPACNDCHGNHGAAPPGVQSVAHVCGQCHAREGALFRASFKKELFAELGVRECTVCHDHHRILHPTPELFFSDSAPKSSKGRVTDADPFSAEIGPLEPGESAVGSWRIVLRPHLEPDDPRAEHTIEVTAEGMTPLVLEATIREGDDGDRLEPRRVSVPEMDATLTIEPLSGRPVEGGDAIRLELTIVAKGRPLTGVMIRDRPGAGLDPFAGSACLTCHESGDPCDQATGKMHELLVRLDNNLRRARHELRRAELAGMEVSGPLFELKSKGTTTAIEARALIHSFEPERLMERTRDGEKVAAEALAAAGAAHAELQFRRKGLAVSLVLVGAVLCALYLKIRQIDSYNPGPRHEPGTESMRRGA